MSDEKDLPEIQLRSSIRVRPYGTDKELEFNHTGDLRRWAQSEAAFWKPFRLEKRADIHPLFNAWSAEQVDLFRSIANACTEIEALAASTEQSEQYRSQQITQRNSAISNQVERVNKGLVLPQDSAVAIRMVSINKRSLISAWAYRAMNHPEIDAHIQNGRIKLPVLLLGAIDAAASNDLLENANAERSRLDEIFNASQKALESTQDARKSDRKETEEFWRATKAAESERAQAWDEKLLVQNQAWERLKKTIEEDMALKAPSFYWSQKKERHRNAAIWFGIAFGAILIGALAAFLGVGHELVTRTSANNSWMGLVPVAIFAFATVWVLRILGRQLANHLQLIEDAGERQAMVMTFLALMYDKDTGAKLITEKDRILILSALFRPSSPSSADDAPPAHWFDLLTNRIGKPGKD